MNNLPKRKSVRLSGYDYSSDGLYFVTVCTEKRACILSQVVGCGVLDAPRIVLTDLGQKIENQINKMNGLYNDISVKKYVVMPNHLHLIIEICGGTSGTPCPTNSSLSKFIGTFKRFVNSEAGKNIWQKSFYDHIIRDDEDLFNKGKYIENNPANWLEDELYTNSKDCL